MRKEINSPQKERAGEILALLHQIHANFIGRVEELDLPNFPKLPFKEAIEVIAEVGAIFGRRNYIGACEYAERHIPEKLAVPDRLLVHPPVKEELKIISSDRDCIIGSLRRMPQGWRLSRWKGHQFYDYLSDYMISILLFHCDLAMVTIMHEHYGHQKAMGLVLKYKEIIIPWGDARQDQLNERIKSDEQRRRVTWVAQSRQMIIEGCLRDYNGQNVTFLFPDYESEADFKVLTRGDVAPEVSLSDFQQSHAGAIESLRRRGVRAAMHVIDTSEYLRWIGKNGLKNSSAARSEFTTLSFRRMLKDVIERTERELEGDNSEHRN